MSCNQMPYQEGVHPKIRDWTTSTLQQAKKNPTHQFWNLRRKQQLCFLLLVFKQRRWPLQQAPPPTAPCPREGMPTCSVRSKHSPTLCLTRVQTDRFSLHSGEGVLLFECAGLLAHGKRWPFSSAPLSQGYERLLVPSALSSSRDSRIRGSPPYV